MKRAGDYQEHLINGLKNPHEAIAYLNAALEDGHPEIFLLAVRNVAEAFGGISKVSKKTKLNRQNLYRMLSKKGNPEFDSLNRLLDSLGFKLAVEVK